MNSTSGEYFERCLKVAPGGVHSPVRAFKSVGGTPIFFKEGSGAHIVSVEDKTYIDFCQSFGPLLLGHRDPEVQEEVMRMVSTMWTSGTCETYSLDLAEWITSQIPYVEKLRFVSSGTEAVMSSLRVARAVTKRDKVIKFEGCYHGHVDSLLVKSGSGLAGKSASDSAGVSEATSTQTLVCPLDDEEHFLKVLAENGQDVAAVILEPLPANFGLLEQRKEFWTTVVEAAQKNCSLVIFDEVISGFRVGLKGMVEVLDIEPDLVTYGKVIGGGLPVGCYGGKAQFMDLVAPSGPVYQAGTLSANPIGMVAGLTTLKKCLRENIWPTLQERATRLVSGFNSWATENNIKLQMKNYGSLIWFCQSGDFPRTVDQISSDHGDRYRIFFKKLLEEGVYMAPSGFEVGFISFAHDDVVLDQALKAFKLAASYVEENI